MVSWCADQAFHVDDDQALTAALCSSAVCALATSATVTDPSDPGGSNQKNVCFVCAAANIASLASSAARPCSKKRHSRIKCNPTDWILGREGRPGCCTA